MTAHVADGGPLPLRDDDPVDVPQMLRRAASRQPTSGVGVEGCGPQPRFTPYPKLLERAERALGGLHNAGLRPGDPVLLQLSRIDDFLVALWACLLGGMRPAAAASPPYDPADPGLERLHGAWRRLGEPVVLGDDVAAVGLAALPADSGWSRVRTLLLFKCEQAEPPPGPGWRPDPDDVAMYLLSSGSTGRAKVIPLTHRGLVELGVAGREQMGMSPGDVAFSWMPIDHSGGLLIYHLTPVFAEASAWYSPTEWVLADPSRWWEVVDERRVNHTWAPTFGFRLAADALGAADPGHFDLSCVSSLLCGGEQILESTMTDFLRVAAPFGVEKGVVLPAWGMTETCSGVAFGRYDEPDAIRLVDGRRFVSVGTVSPGTQMRVVDRDGTPLPAAQVGRLQLRSARITPGYLNDPEADAAAFTADGWFDTGDLAQLNGRRLTVVGRAKEVIVLNGDNYSCHEIEEAARVPGVRDDCVAAVGVPDETRGSELLAVVYVPEPEADRDETAPAIQAALGERLGLSAARIVPVAEADFPRTDNGKVRRGELRERLARQAATPPPRPRATVSAHGRGQLRSRMLEVFRDVLGIDVAPDRPLYEQGVDSVRLPRLAAELSRALDSPISTTTLLSRPHVNALAESLARVVALEAAPTPAAAPPDRRVAVIGMSGRFPGADSVEQLWENLRGGVESVRRFDAAQLAAAGVPRAEYEHPDYVPVSGVLGAAGPAAALEFAADLFGVSAREAAMTDPQHRLFLECCHQLLEQVGYAGGGPRVGVFAGSGMNLYSHHTYLLRHLHGQLSDPLAAMQAAVGNQPDFLAARAAYRLDLTGPAINVQTACSTGLVAVHLAVQSLLAGDAEVALAGASAVHMPQVTGYTYMDGSVLSAAGRCRPFDAAADGTVGGNGVAAVALKRLDRALADGDVIHAVVAGSAVNNDGADKVGFTAPGVSGQVAAITAALDSAGLSSDAIDYVEAHGTGTKLGDPLELRALHEAFAARAVDAGRGRCAVGSLKANLGHLDSCAGIAGLIKATLALRAELIPPQINFTQLNPEIDLDDGPFFIPVEPVKWPGTTRPRRAGVQALGVGGTNAHVIVEEAPASTHEPFGHAGPPTVVLSGHTRAALDELAGAVAARLRRPDAPSAPDLLTTTALGRRHREHRLAAWGDDAAALADALENPSSPDTVRGHASRPGPLAFVCSGQGEWRAGCGRELYDSSPAFRHVVDRCAARYRARWDGDLLTPLLDPSADPPRETELVQPALFAYQAALAAAWAELGVRPDFVAGHSVGEYAAWHVAGGVGVEDGLDLTAQRGRLMQQLTEPGAMTAVRADRRAVDAVLAVVSGVELAVVNGPREHVLSGEPEAVAEATLLLERRAAATKTLPVRRAFHSALLEPMLPQLRDAARAVEFTPTATPLIDSVDGATHPPGSLADADYCCRQTRRAARWDLAVTTLAQAGCELFVEIGPDTVLTSVGRRLLPQGRWTASRQSDDGGVERAAAQLHCAGAPVDWRPLASGGRRVPLPTHPLHRKTYLIDPSPSEPAEENPR